VCPSPGGAGDQTGNTHLAPLHVNHHMSIT
jgi:hypothetical protein